MTSTAVFFGQQIQMFFYKTLGYLQPCLWQSRHEVVHTRAGSEYCKTHGDSIVKINIPLWKTTHQRLLCKWKHCMTLHMKWDSTKNGDADGREKKTKWQKVQSPTRQQGEWFGLCRTMQNMLVHIKGFFLFVCLLAKRSIDVQLCHHDILTPNPQRHILLSESQKPVKIQRQHIGWQQLYISRAKWSIWVFSLRSLPLFVWFKLCECGPAA